MQSLAGQTTSLAASAVSSHVSLDRHSDHVALTVHRLDDPRRARVIAKCLPQSAHAHVDAAVERVKLAPAHELDQLRTREQTWRVREQECKQLELGAAERYDVTHGARQRAGRRI